MDKTTNMEDFEECAAVVFAALYESFPQPKYIDPRRQDVDPADPKVGVRPWEDSGKLFVWNDTSIVFSKDHTKEKEARAHNALKTYEWSIRFMLQEGFIRNTNVDDSRFDLVLTAKGLAVLNAVPKVIEGKPLSLIQRVKNALTGQSTEAVKDVVKSIIVQSLSLAAHVVT